MPHGLKVKLDNPEILKWARREIGLSELEVANRFKKSEETITSYSPLRRLPSGLNIKQTLFFDAIRYSVEMADMSHCRLKETLIDLTGKFKSTKKKDLGTETVRAFLDAWSIVDSINRLKALLNQLPYAKKNGPGLVVFQKNLTRKMKGYTGQERRLMSALRLDIATPNIVLDEINQMKKEREADEKRLTNLIQTKENINKMVDMEANLKELCARIITDLDNCTNQDKKDAYTYLDLKVKAIPESADIKGYLDPSVLSDDSRLLTTGQTSA